MQAIGERVTLNNVPRADCLPSSAVVVGSHPGTGPTTTSGDGSAQALLYRIGSESEGSLGLRLGRRPIGSRVMSADAFGGDAGASVGGPFTDVPMEYISCLGHQMTKLYQCWAKLLEQQLIFLHPFPVLRCTGFRPSGPIISGIGSYIL